MRLPHEANGDYIRRLRPIATRLNNDAEQQLEIATTLSTTTTTTAPTPAAAAVSCARSGSNALMDTLVHSNAPLDDAAASAGDHDDDNNDDDDNDDVDDDVIVTRDDEMMSEHDVLRLIECEKVRRASRLNAQVQGGAIQY
jgi:hypothetical protein